MLMGKALSAILFLIPNLHFGANVMFHITMRHQKNLHFGANVMNVSHYYASPLKSKITKKSEL